MVVHFDWYGGGYLCKHDTTKISMIPWLVCNVQTVVAMVTRSSPLPSSSAASAGTFSMQVLFKITVAINQLNLSSQNFQPYCISEMQTLWGEPEHVVTIKHHFHMLNST